MIKKFVEEHVLKAYQCDRYGFMRPIMLMNELQGLADKHAALLGAGRADCIAQNMGWVITHYFIDIISMPRSNQKLMYTTWPSDHGAVRSVRDFEIRDESCKLCVRATSQWVLLDLDTRRVLRISDRLPDWGCINERAWDRSFDKGPDFVPTKSMVLSCRFDDIDVNQHINNAVYAVWATESVGFTFRNEHKLRGMEFYFEHEIMPDTPTVRIEVWMSETETRHKIMVGGKEHAKVICYWDKL